jgi:hypothetical protein
MAVLTFAPFLLEVRRHAAVLPAERMRPEAIEDIERGDLCVVAAIGGDA